MFKKIIKKNLIQFKNLEAVWALKILLKTFLIVQSSELCYTMELPKKIEAQAQHHESIPSYLSPHRHYKVSLHPYSAKQLALNLTCDDQSACVDYQWNGKTIAQLFTGNKKVLLESTTPLAYNFLVPHPLEAGELIININGKIIFQESVAIQGMALIACKSLKNKKYFCASALNFSGVKFINGASFSIAGKNFERVAYITSQSAAIKTDSFRQNSSSSIECGDIELETKELSNTGLFNGNVKLKFTGNADQLKNIGTINGSFAYHGPVANQDGTNVPSADELAEGHGAWGRVVDPEIISFDAKDPIDLKREHNINHTFVAKTSDRIQTNKTIQSKGSVVLHAGTDLSHKSIIAKGHVVRVAETGTITAESTVERVHNNTGYADQVHQVFVDAEKYNSAYAGKDIIQTAVWVKSGKEGTLLKAEGNIVDKALTYITYIEKQSATACTKDTYTNHEVSLYNSTGGFSEQAGVKYSGMAPIFDIQGEPKIIRSGQSAEIVDVNNVHEHESIRTQEESKTHAPHQFPGNVKRQTDYFWKNVHQGEGTICPEFFENCRHTGKISSQRLITAARFLFNISLSITTQGLTAPLGTGLYSMDTNSVISAVLARSTNGTVRYLLNKTANALSETNGDIRKTVQCLATHQTLKEIGLTAPSARVAGGSRI